MEGTIQTARVSAAGARARANKRLPQSDNVSFSNLDTALQQENTQIRLFGKPNINGKRRMGVAVCRDFDLRSARAKAKKVAESKFN